MKINNCAVNDHLNQVNASHKNNNKRINSYILCNYKHAKKKVT